MKKLFAALKSAPKRVAMLAIVAAAIAVPAGLYAWGPDRPEYTLEDPADHVVFNSITNNAKHGNEFNFVQIREAGTGNYGEEVQIQPGKEYEVYVFYHNNAATKYNSAEYDHKGIAQNAQMRVQMPASVKAGEKARITGFVSADNAQPKTVWDEAYAASSSNVALRYVQNSATITNTGKTNGAKMPDSLLTTGAPLGYDALDGKLPGCNEFSGYVIFRFKAVQPGFEVEKQVSKSGENNYQKSVATTPGATVDYKIQYKNTGSVKQDNVVIKDTLPAGVTYIPGSTHVATSATNGQWTKIESDEVVGKGINIGSYLPNGNAYVKFSAKVANNDDLAECGVNKLTNKAEAQTDNGTKDDTADVTVPKECKEQPEYKCTALAVSKLSDTKFKFETGYTVKGGTFKSVSYTIRNEAGQVVDTVAGTPNAVEYTQATPGKYSVQATVTFTVDGKDVTATGEACKKAFEVPTPQSKEIEVCDLESKKVITIKEEDFDSSKHSKNLNDCKETPPTEHCEVPGKEHLPKNSTDCDTPATTPSELPQTGSADGVLTLAGLSMLALALGYAVTARRTLG